MSVYSDELTLEGTAKAIKRLHAAFPALTDDFYTTLADRLKDLKIGNERLADSINYVIDNCEYPTPTIAQFIMFDKKIELLTHEQLVNKNNLYQGIAKYYKAVKIEGITQPMWAHVNNIEQYKLKLFNE